jgi:transcription antitermination factor NusG
MHPHSQFWFALNAKVRREKHISGILELKGYEVFLPLHRTIRRWSDRIKEIQYPLFPGYIFCRFDPNDKLPILTISGVLSIVGIGKMPVPVDEVEVDTIRTIIQSGLPVCPYPHFQAGHTVQIDYGPLRGLEGIILDSEPCKKKLIVSVTLLRRSVAVSIDPNWVSNARFVAKSAGQS